MLKTYANNILDLLPNFLWPIKPFLLKLLIDNCGKRSKLSHRSLIYHLNKFRMGNDVFIGPNFFCSTINLTIIRDRVMVGGNCSIIGGDHKHDNPKQNMRFNKELGDNRDIIIEEDAWIGHGTTILKNSRIREGVIIGANSLINSDTLPYSVYVGQPAKFIKPRFESLDDLEKYLQMMKTKYNFTTKYDSIVLNEIYNRST